MHLWQYICKELKVSREQLSQLSKKAPKMYKVYAIPKRNSGKRIIAHPAKEVKRYQKCLIQNLEAILPVHERAFAYKKGTSIRKNAEQHQHSRYLLKMDFNNFFNSITSKLCVEKLKEARTSLSSEDIAIISDLAFWCPSKETDGLKILSVGAPSSPLISNWIMFEFDEVLNQFCSDKNIIYTRYADDLTFSTKDKNILFELPVKVKAVLFSFFGNNLSINDSKTIFSSKGHNRHVTGITLTNDNRLSIGRERKRYISMLVHKFKIGELPTEDIEHLCGLISFANHIEPNFKLRLEKKYSSEVLNDLFSLRGVDVNE